MGFSGEYPAASFEAIGRRICAVSDATLWARDVTRFAYEWQAGVGARGRLRSRRRWTGCAHVRALALAIRCQGLRSRGGYALSQYTSLCQDNLDFASVSKSLYRRYTARCGAFRVDAELVDRLVLRNIRASQPGGSGRLGSMDS